MRKWIEFNYTQIKVDKIIYIRKMNTYIEIGMNQGCMHETFNNDEDIIRRYSELMDELGIIND